MKEVAVGGYGSVDVPYRYGHNTLGIF